MTYFVTTKKIHDFGSQGHGSGMAFSLGGDTLATGNKNDIWLWRIPERDKLKTLFGNGYTNALMYSPDGKTLLSSHYHRLMVWDMDTYECKFEVEIKSERVIKALGYSPLGTTIAATINYNKNWKLWDAETFDELYSSDEYTESITALDYAPSGKTIAIGSSDKTVGIWSLSDFNLQNNLQNSDAVTCIKYSPDGRLLAVGCQDHRIHIWDMTNGEKIKTFSNHDASITELFWFSGTEIIASSDDEGDILFWQTADGKFLDRLSKFNNSIWNPNKQVIATSNKHLQLWKVETKLDVIPITNTQQENDLLERDLRQPHIGNAEVMVDSVNSLHMENVMINIDVKLGDNAIIHGDFVVAESIKDSFNQADSANVSDDLKSTLTDLAVAIGKMSKKLPDESAKQVARDLKALTAEATSSSPRQQSWELSVEDIKKAAKNVGEIGKPVLELAAKIVPILLATSA